MEFIMPELIDKHRSFGQHIQFSDSIIFITWRLAFTLPKHLLVLYDEFIKEVNVKEKDLNKEDQKKHHAFLLQRYREYDLELGKHQQPGIFLNEAEIAGIISNAFHFFDGARYELHAWCIMSNHVHVLLRALQNKDGEYYLISSIIQSLKRFTANKINQVKGRQGQVWDDFYFDRIIRNISDYQNVVNYILHNPVAAGLIDSADKWRDSYINSRFVLH